MKIVLPLIIPRLSPRGGHHPREPPKNDHASADQDEKLPLDPVPSIMDNPELRPSMVNSAPQTPQVTVHPKVVPFKPDQGALCKDSESSCLAGPTEFLSSVTMKMITYFGIGWLGSEIIPRALGYLG